MRLQTSYNWLSVFISPKTMAALIVWVLASIIPILAGDCPIEIDASKTSASFTNGSNVINITPTLISVDCKETDFSQVTSLAISSSVRIIGANAFYSNIARFPKLDTIDLSSAKNLTKIDTQAFLRALKIKHINFERATSLKEIGLKAFEGTGLEGNITLPPSLDVLSESSFAKNYFLTGVDMSLTNITTLKAKGFSHCDNLVHVQLSPNLTYIEGGVFQSCAKVMNIVFPDKLEIIAEGFVHTDLRRIVMPASVRSLDFNAFAFNLNLEKVTFLGQFPQVDASTFQHCPALKPENVWFERNGNSSVDILRSFTMNLKTEDPFSAAQTMKCNEDQPCACEAGFGNSLTGIDSDFFFTCVPCPVGHTSTVPLSDDACEPCAPGRWAAATKSFPCNLCSAGKYSNEKGATSDAACLDCSPGYYTPLAGSEECKVCPPGNFCGGNGTVDYSACHPGTYQNKLGGAQCLQCPVGKYTTQNMSAACVQASPGTYCPDEGMRDVFDCPPGRYSETGASNCTECARGRYQERAGQGQCTLCESGKYGQSAGSMNASMCVSCQPGFYSALQGASNCLKCPTGQVQPDQGQDSCKECALEGTIKTNNEARTACIDNPALLSTSMVVMMFNKGVALALAFTAAVVFLALAVAMHKMKAKYSSDSPSSNALLASLEMHQVVVKSVLPGFSFGSEMVLIWGMMTEARGLGTAMLVFRLLHPITVILLTYALYAPARLYVLPKYFREMVHKAPLHEGFMRMNVPAVGLLLLASACDVSVLQLMPWQQCRFYDESMGYPSMDLMLICMGVKMIQALVSVVCQSAYLNRNGAHNDPTMSNQARALFGMSIAMSLVTLTMGAVILLLKWALLKKMVKEQQQEEEKKRKNEEDGEDGGLELGDLYREAEAEGSVTLAANPMHSAAMDLVVELRERNATLEAEILQLRERGRVEGDGTVTVQEEPKPMQPLQQHLTPDNTENGEGVVIL